MPFGRRKKLLNSASNQKQLTKQNSQKPGNKRDFIIVGAGMSGLYTSYRLHQIYADATVTFIESTDRIGGRLMSVNIGEGSQVSEGGDIYIEKGGMRILTGYQPLVENLVKELDIGLYNPPPTTVNNFDYYRGRRVYPAQVKTGNVPYNLTASEKGKSGEELLEMGISLVLQQNGISNQERESRGNSLTFWESLNYNGIPLTEWNSNMWFHSYLSTDGVNYVFASQGYDSFPTLANLAIFLFYNNSDRVIFRGNTDAFKFIQGGYSSLPNRLYQIALENGDTFHFNAELQSVSQRGKVSDITVTHNSQDPKHSYTKTYTTPNLVLAVPVNKLKTLSITQGNIKGIDDGTLSQFHQYLESVRGYDAYRIFPVFKDAWWRDRFGIIGGRCNTNTPFKQVYYWNSPAKGKGPGVLLLYSDYYDAETMETYIPQKPTSDANDQKNIPSVLNPTQLQSLRRLLSQIHNTEVPPIERAYIKWWPEAWDLYLPHNKPSKTFNNAPTVLDPISVVGVGMSLDQGWVEGALQTVERLLSQRQF